MINFLMISSLMNRLIKFINFKYNHIMYQGGYMIKSVSISEIKNLNNINLIDIRSNTSYNNGHIKNASNITLNELLIKPDKYLNKNEIYYIYCQKGMQSRKLCQILLNQNYNVINITGGYEAWVLSE